jgi:cation diffusion facilitator CzcD-associated flavoprotein CzcO
MITAVDILDAIVIGAGWAGLGVSHSLKRRGLRHQMLDAVVSERLGAHSVGTRSG